MGTVHDMGIERKVRALLSKTIDRGCTVGEHISALEMALRIVKQHGLIRSRFAWPEPPPGHRWEGDAIVIDNQYREPGPRRLGSKEQMLIDLMMRGHGASMSEMMQATGWQPHSVRGVLSILRKKRNLNIRNVRSWKKGGRDARYFIDT